MWCCAWAAQSSRATATSWPSPPHTSWPCSLEVWLRASRSVCLSFCLCLSLCLSLSLCVSLPPPPTPHSCGSLAENQQSVFHFVSVTTPHPHSCGGLDENQQVCLSFCLSYHCPPPPPPPMVVWLRASRSVCLSFYLPPPPPPTHVAVWLRISRSVCLSFCLSPPPLLLSHFISLLSVHV